MNIGFDFFLFIAFFIPGVFLLYAITMVYTPLKNFLANEINGKENYKWLLALSLCILLGMMSSIFRNMIIDPSFRSDYSSLSLLPQSPHWKATARVEPDYSRLTKDDLEVLQELKNEEKRPYQFYGNTIIAILCFIVCFLVVCIKAKSRQKWWQFTVAVIILLVFSWILYTGSRFSHHNYMNGVSRLNEKPLKVATGG
ncbi:hypothetical protein D3H65_05965 [Paraflavitalea soli]|uniref:Uncharacterized protein n=1 Tax=Paraflavitalea soli TaxID=2315862 RepID=A0A3B7MGQ2_9BACT|nr:hypothetical protein [Paraflavitalea soli]AXY73552.1 hypothetical protein D3H65_05965 [Paraflavitalea soli]